VAVRGVGRDQAFAERLHRAATRVTGERLTKFVSLLSPAEREALRRAVEPQSAGSGRAVNLIASGGTAIASGTEILDLPQRHCRWSSPRSCPAPALAERRISMYERLAAPLARAAGPRHARRHVRHAPGLTTTLAQQKVSHHNPA
jgi:hypothetical protein